MDPFVFALALGAAGLGVMSLGGLAGHGHHGHDGHVHHGPAHDATPHHATPHFANGHDGARVREPGLAWALLSPRVLFSVLVGFGAAGLLLRGLLGGPALWAAAVLGGAAFEALLVRPLWNLAFRFASAPALTLGSALLDEARAVSRFDANGQGLIALEVDGQVVQVLGTLRAEDRAAGVRVRAGDRLRVEEVDEARGRCTVSPADGR